MDTACVLDSLVRRLHVEPMVVEHEDVLNLCWSSGSSYRPLVAADSRLNYSLELLETRYPTEILVRDDGDSTN